MLNSCRIIRDQFSAARIASQFGLDSICRLVLVRRYMVERKPYQEFQVHENLFIQRSPPLSYSSEVGQVEARENIYEISGISRAISLDWVYSTGVSFWVNSQVINHKIVEGWEGEFISIDLNNELVYKLTLRRKPDERKSY